MLSRVKLIAEPWDLGPGGYQVGNFPVGWTEWNGKYRDTRRGASGAATPGQIGGAGVPAHRAAATSTARPARSPYASINFVTCHDGFTLRDLVSYEHKHNEANGEDNRDGTDDNWSRNWGVEGDTDAARRDPRCASARRATSLATLAFSQGVPMLSHGDELGRTQRGNNNAYCQDNEITWIDWSLDARAAQLLAVHARGLRAAPPPPGAAPPKLLPRRSRRRRRRQGRDLATPRRRGAHRRGLASRSTPTRSAC